MADRHAPHHPAPHGEASSACPLVDVVIPVHNRRDITLTCLRDLREQEGANFRVTVIDDGSSDGTSEAISREFPEVTLLAGDGDLWWGGAVNLGIADCLGRTTRPTHVVLLNDDIRLETSFMKTLVACAEQHSNALIGSLAVFESNRSKVLWCGSAATQAQCIAGCISRSSLSGVVTAETLPGRGLIIPSAVFDKIGLFDVDLFPHYFSDVDFSLRARDAGFALLCCCDASLALRAEETAVGNVTRKVDWWTFMKTFRQDRSPNHLRTLWAFHRRHTSRTKFVHQVARIVLGDAARRLGIRRTSV